MKRSCAHAQVQSSAREMAWEEDAYEQASFDVWTREWDEAHPCVIEQMSDGYDAWMGAIQARDDLVRYKASARSEFDEWCRSVTTGQTVNESDDQSSHTHPEMKRLLELFVGAPMDPNGQNDGDGYVYTVLAYWQMVSNTIGRVKENDRIASQQVGRSVLPDSTRSTRGTVSYAEACRASSVVE